MNRFCTTIIPLSVLLLLAPAFCWAQVATKTAPKQTLSADRMFAADRITEVNIELANEDWDKIRAQSRSIGESLKKVPAVSPFTYVKGNITIDGVLIKDVGIRKKGFIGSLNTERPSLKIKFEEYIDQSPVTGLDRLTLNNNNQDAARVCQFLSYKMYRESGTVAPRCGFAKVTVNGKYLGIYSNVESVKTDFLIHGFGNGSGALFEGTVADFFPNWIQKFETKNKAASTSMLGSISKIFEQDEIDLEKLESVIDVQAFTRFWAMESLIGFWDGYCAHQNNFFVYQNPANSKFYFIPWGTDSCFTNTFPLPPYKIRPRSVHAKAIIPNRLYRNKETKSAYVETLMSMLDEHWQEDKLLAEIDRLENMLRPHLLKENRGFEATLNGYREFIKGRRAAIMREFRNGPPKLNSREKQPVYFAEIGTAEVTFKTKWFKRRPKRHSGIGEASLKLEVDGKAIELSDVGVFANPDERTEGHSTVVVVGTRNSNKKTIVLAASMPNSQFKPGEHAVKGALIQMTSLGMVGAKFRMMSGTANLKEASTKPGQPVEGTLSLTITQMKTK